MKFEELPQELKDWFLGTDHIYGTVRLLKFLEFLQDGKIPSVTEYLNQIFHLGKSAGSCKCGGSCGCQKPTDVELPNPFKMPTPSYPKQPILCPACGIDLAINRAYCCMRTDCPSFAKPMC